MKTAIVIGGSLGGLLAANLLLRSGWNVHVYERVADELAERGAGIVTHPELFEAFARIGISSAQIGVEVPARVTVDRSGKCIGNRPHPQTLTAWGRLYVLLKNALPAACYSSGKQLVEVTQQPGAVSARFADGTVANADLLIGADGIRSTVRAQFAPEVKPQYAGYVAWRGLVEEADLTLQTHRDIFDYFGFCLPPREQMLGYPVAGAHNAMEPGKRRYNFVWYRPADEDELRRLSTDDSGAGGIDPDVAIGSLDVTYEGSGTIAASADRNPKNFVDAQVDVKFLYSAGFGSVSAGGFAKIEADQTFDNTQTVVGARATWAKRGVLARNDLIALYANYGSVEPGDDEARKTALAVTELDSYERTEFEAVYIYPTGWSVVSAIELNYRHFQEIDAPAAIEAAGIDSHTLSTVRLALPKDMFLAYSKGKLPFDRADDKVLEIGFSYKLF